MITLEVSRVMAADDGSTTEAGEAALWRHTGLSRSGLSRFLRTAQKAVGLPGDVEVLLAGDKTLRRLNRTFRAKNKATDVLSFPAAQGSIGGHAGDLAISLETATRQAEEHGHMLRDEVRVLLLHGLLHLSGMDHEVDAGEMASKEAALRKQLRLPGGLIERVEGSTKATTGAVRSARKDLEKLPRTKAKVEAFEAIGAKKKRGGRRGKRRGLSGAGR